jgi:hypothetical protein
LILKDSFSVNQFSRSNHPIGILLQPRSPEASDFPSARISGKRGRISFEAMMWPLFVFRS